MGNSGSWDRKVGHSGDFPGDKIQAKLVLPTQITCSRYAYDIEYQNAFLISVIFFSSVLLQYVDPVIITSCKNDKNETPFTLAYKLEQPKVVKLLLEHVISVQGRENSKSDISEEEGESGHLQLIKGKAQVVGEVGLSCS